VVEFLETAEAEQKEVFTMVEEEKKVAEAATAVDAKDAATMAAVMHDENAPVITMKKLLEAGSHFGHQTRRWNPKMKKYIYCARNGVYIIDLAQTVALVCDAYKAMKAIVDNGGKVLFVGTKQQIAEVVTQEALRSGSFYITNRWLGGTLTNFKTIQGRIRYLKDLERREEEGEFELLPKVEAAQLRKEKEKLSKNLDGIKEMRKIPNALFVVDPNAEHNAVAEAKRLGIPVFGIVDTNSNPDLCDYVIPANDDAVRSVSLILAVIADAIVESKGGAPVVAYTKDEGEDVTMKEVIKQTEKENAEKLAKIRAERAARQEAFEKEQAERAAKRAAMLAADGNGDKKAAKAPAKKPAAKKEAAPKADDAKAEPAKEGESK
jgi:small subunit ribosomal protein S2